MQRSLHRGILSIIENYEYTLKNVKKSILFGQYKILASPKHKKRAWDTKLHSSQLATPLLKTLLKELRNDAFSVKTAKR